MINLNYYFGCGGFYALWIILLGTDYCCEFENDNRSLDDIYKDQWNVQNISTWKSTEVRPDNNSSVNLKFYTNPTKETWDSETGKKIIIYTDIDTQFKLAKEKRAGLWLPGYNLNIIKEILDVYDNLKADSWPLITNYIQLHQLQDYQKVELEERNLKIFEDPFETFKYMSSCDFNDKKVWHQYCPYIKDNLACDLLDIIDTNGECLLQPLGYKLNQKCIDFTEHYKKINKGLL